MGCHGSVKLLSKISEGVKQSPNGPFCVAKSSTTCGQRSGSLFLWTGDGLTAPDMALVTDSKFYILLPLIGVYSGQLNRPS